MNTQLQKITDLKVSKEVQEYIVILQQQNNELVKEITEMMSEDLKELDSRKVDLDKCKIIY